VDVAALLKEACAEFRTRAEETSLEFECEGEDSLRSLPKVSADRDRIFQVLQNLVGNAIKFTPEGGRITLRVEPRDEDVVFSVSDTGPGIAEEDLEHIFDPYWRPKMQAKAGAGLGLSISRGIVEAHGGRIWAESEVGKGSTFHFTIPVAKPSRGASPDTIPQAP
jgi:signal transduction histidine kinase